jgi:hypothetical protein
MAAPVQRGTAHDTVTAPTSTIFTIDGTSFRRQPFADQEQVKNEAGADLVEVFQNPGHRVSFTGHLKASQTALIPGDLLPLTYSGGSVITYVVESAETEGFGKVTKQTITAKKGDAATYV